MRPKRLETKGGCPVELTVSVLGGVWKPMIVYHLLVNGKMRFMALARAVPEATQRMLALQLRELEADGIVTREVFPEVPPRVEYELTEIGLALGPVMKSLRGWGLAFQRSRLQHGAPVADTAPEPDACLLAPSAGPGGPAA